MATLSPATLLKPRAERVVAALDVGTSKVAALIAEVDGEGNPRVIGAGVRACAGLRHGLVADMGRTEDAIRAALQQAERAAGIEVERVFVNISAGDLASSVTAVEIDIAGHRIAGADMKRLLVEGRDAVFADAGASGRAMLHAEPALFTVDGLEGVRDPTGFHAHQLGVDIHVVTAATPPCRNLDLAVRNAHLDVEALVASGVAASLAVLDAEERELGVALVELGAGVTTIAVHGGGVLAGLAAIPVGAAAITADIAASFATRRTAAEKLKTLNGAALASPRDNHEMIDIPALEGEEGEGRRVPRAELIAVIRARLDMIFGEVAAALDLMGFRGPAGRQVVLTGGGAELRGIADFAAGALARNVRVGRPRGLPGLPDAHASPAYATLAGLLLFASKPRLDLVRMPGSGQPITPASEPRTLFGRLFATLKREI